MSDYGHVILNRKFYFQRVQLYDIFNTLFARLNIQGTGWTVLLLASFQRSSSLLEIFIQHCCMHGSTTSDVLASFEQVFMVAPFNILRAQMRRLSGGRAHLRAALE